MSLLLETTVGDLVIDLDVDGSPELCQNVLKLAKARYYTSTLVYNIQVNRFCQLGDPRGDGSGGACIFGLLDSSDGSSAEESTKRFLKSRGRHLTNEECQEKGRVVATEMTGIPDTIGSQFLITIAQGEGMALDGYTVGKEETSHTASVPGKYLSLGVVAEDDDNVLDQIAHAYCDASGRPYADIRIIRALVVHDPFDDPPGMEALLKKRGVVVGDGERVVASPSLERPPEERVERRIAANQVDIDDEEDIEKARARETEMLRKEDRSRAVVLEMLGDLPSAEIKAPENVLFVCKLNSITEDEDLELIFSRFDQNVKAEVIRDHDTGASLQYAFVEFTTKEQAVEAYFKMNNTLIDDRRIKVDFSQSVSKMWDKYSQKMRMPRYHGSAPENRHGNRGAPSRRSNRDDERPHGNRRENQTQRVPSRREYRAPNDSGYDRRHEREARRPGNERDEFGRNRDWDGRPRDHRSDEQNSRRHSRDNRGRHSDQLSRREDESQHRRSNERHRYSRQSKSPSPDDSRDRSDSRSRSVSPSRREKRKKRKKHRRRKRRDDDDDESSGERSRHRHRQRRHRHDSDQSDESNRGRHRDRKDIQKETREHRRRHNSEDDDQEHEPRRKRERRHRDHYRKEDPRDDVYSRHDRKRSKRHKRRHSPTP